MLNSVMCWVYLVFWTFHFRWRWDLLMVARLTCPQNFLEYTAQLLTARSGLLGVRRWFSEQFFIPVLSKDLWFLILGCAFNDISITYIYKDLRFLDSIEKSKRIVVPLLVFHCVIGFFHKMKLIIIFSFKIPY